MHHYSPKHCSVLNIYSIGLYVGILIPSRAKVRGKGGVASKLKFIPEGIKIMSIASSGLCSCLIHILVCNNSIYHASNSHECMGVNAEALQLHVVDKKLYFLL